MSNKKQRIVNMLIDNGDNTFKHRIAFIPGSLKAPSTVPSIPCTSMISLRKLHDDLCRGDEDMLMYVRMKT